MTWVRYNEKSVRVDRPLVCTRCGCRFAPLDLVTEFNGMLLCHTQCRGSLAEGLPTSTWVETSRTTTPTSVEVTFKESVKETPMPTPDTKTPIQALHSDLFTHVGEGVKAGTASELCTILVDGFANAFNDDAPIVALIAKNRFGRAFLSLAIPYGLAVLCVVAPGAIPGGASGAATLRKVCLYAIQGHATFAVKPVIGRLKGVIRTVISAAVEAKVVEADND